MDKCVTDVADICKAQKDSVRGVRVKWFCERMQC